MEVIGIASGRFQDAKGDEIMGRLQDGRGENGLAYGETRVTGMV